jgi:hypothetical protein
VVSTKGIPKLLDLCLEDVKAIGSLTEPIIRDIRWTASRVLCTPTNNLHD